jgi:cell division protein FtsZ
LWNVYINFDEQKTGVVVMKFELEEAAVNMNGMPLIKVIGLGGGGCNALDFMVRSQIVGVDFIAANTDAQALNKSKANTRIQLGKSGLGAGSNVEKGKQAATEDIDRVRTALDGTHMLFVTAGMGGGTGTGSAPVVAKAARDMGILTVGVVTSPYSFEKRDKIAAEGIADLEQHVDSLIVIPNEKLHKVAGKKLGMLEAFNMANKVLHNAVRGVSEVVTREGLINVDFEDVRTMMGFRGVAMMGVGSAKGDERAKNATMAAISSPLLEDVSINGARGILVNVVASEDLGSDEFEEVGHLIESFAHPEAMIKIGLAFDENLGDEVQVTIIATGLVSSASKVQKPAEAAKIIATEAVTPVVEAAVRPSRWATPNLTPSATAPLPNIPGLVSGNIAGLRQGASGVIGAPHNESHAYLNIPSWIRKQAN